MKKRNGWLYAFWILLIVILVLALAVGLISWAGTEESEEGSIDGGSRLDVTSVSLDKEQLDLETEGDNATATLTAIAETSDGETFGGLFLGLFE